MMDFSVKTLLRQTIVVASCALPWMAYSQDKDFLPSTATAEHSELSRILESFEKRIHELEKNESNPTDDYIDMALELESSKFIDLLEVKKLQFKYLELSGVGEISDYVEAQKLYLKSGERLSELTGDLSYIYKVVKGLNIIVGNDTFDGVTCARRYRNAKCEWAARILERIATESTDKEFAARAAWELSQLYESRVLADESTKWLLKATETGNLPRAKLNMALRYISNIGGNYQDSDIREQYLSLLAQAASGGIEEARMLLAMEYHLDGNLDKAIALIEETDTQLLKLLLNDFYWFKDSDKYTESEGRFDLRDLERFFTLQSGRDKWTVVNRPYRKGVDYRVEMAERVEEYLWWRKDKYPKFKG